ncbi:FAS1-like dehydratase domain-containing protein [Rhodococcus triatomae]
MSTHEFPVEAGHILMFARAIGDENPAYTDRRSEAAAEFGDALAPPTFVIASAQFNPEYELRPKRGHAWLGSAKDPSGAPPDDAGWLHAEQHFEYSRPIIAGETLKVTEREGETWDKGSRSGGTLKFVERLVEYRSVATGALVVLSRFVYVLPLPAEAKK